MLSTWESTEEVVWPLALRAHLLLAMAYRHAQHLGVHRGSSLAIGLESTSTPGHGLQACSISTSWASEFQAALVHLRAKQYLCCIAQGTLLNVMWQPGWKGSLERMDTCTCMAESLCYPPETVTTLLPSPQTTTMTKSLGGWGTDSPSLFF